MGIVGRPVVELVVGVGLEQGACSCAVKGAAWILVPVQNAEQGMVLDEEPRDETIIINGKAIP